MFNKPLPTNDFELWEYHYEFNGDFIGLCDKILGILDQSENVNQEERNSWSNKKSELRREQRGLIERILESLIDDNPPLSIAETNRRGKINIYKRYLLDIDKRLFNLELIEPKIRLSEIMHLSSRHNSTMGDEVWLDIAFNSLSDKLVLGKGNQSHTLEYEYCIKKASLHIELNNASLITYTDTHSWLYVDKDGTNTGQWGATINGDNMNRYSWIFEKSDFLCGLCYNQKLGRLDPRDKTYNISCILQLEDNTGSFHFRPLYPGNREFSEEKKSRQSTLAPYLYKRLKSRGDIKPLLENFVLARVQYQRYE
jgi:hypothetical protein